MSVSAISSSSALHNRNSALRARPAAPVAARRTPLRLTRRGRFVFVGTPLLLAAAALLMLAGFFNAPAVAAEIGDGVEPTAAVTYTVAPGDTLWSVAATVAPAEDVREVVAGMVELNSLQSATIHAGQRLFVPTGS